MLSLDYLLLLHKIFNPLSRDRINKLPSRPVYDENFFITRGFPPGKSLKISRPDLKEDVLCSMEKCKKRGWKIISYFDREYPSFLKDISHPPLILFVQGDLSLLEKPSIAVVGTRRPSEYGRKIAFDFSRALASKGLVIISGLAAGIDSYAHKGAIEEGKTIAVLGSGFENLYPAFNKKLAQKIVERGALVSEFFPEEKPAKYKFPMRNRIIAGLSIATLVVEAGEKSGALITARFALDYGRDVMAIPGNIGREKSSGCNKLIQQGAKLVMKVEDILEEFHYLPFSEERKKEEISEEEKILLKFIPFDKSIDVEYLSEITGMGVERLFPLLLNLEIKGYISQIAGWRYMRNHE